MRTIPEPVRVLMRSYSSSGHKIDDIVDRFPGYSRDEVLDAMHLRYRMMQIVNGKPRILSSFDNPKVACDNFTGRQWEEDAYLVDSEAKRVMMACTETHKIRDEKELIKELGL